MDVFGVLVGQNGETNQEKQKCLNAYCPNILQLLRQLVITRLLQLITPKEESVICLLQESYANIPTPLFIHLRYCLSRHQT
jgi:hypothetical protein